MRRPLTRGGLLRGKEEDAAVPGVRLRGGREPGDAGDSAFADCICCCCCCCSWRSACARKASCSCRCSASYGGE